ncbi:hypothetical protein GALL_500240 [mine drainage metagenome]|uniref:Uncharacterized protein n=1 Tax=mine drainage metagenome TaxID=410659 RepID=A0A1J5PC99_9ZZZZ
MAHDVGLDVGVWIDQRVTHPGLGGQMHDPLDIGVRGHQIANRLVILCRGHGSGFDLFKTFEFIDFFTIQGDLLKHRPALTLEFPQHVGHSHIGEYQVVPTGCFALIAIKAAHVGVQIICAATVGSGTRA